MEEADGACAYVTYESDNEEIPRFVWFGRSNGSGDRREKERRDARDLEELRIASALREHRLHFAQYVVRPDCAHREDSAVTGGH